VRNNLRYQLQDMISKDPTRAIPMRNRLVALDGLRSLAALQVLVFHSHRVLWYPQPETVFWSAIHEVATFPFQYGFQAVVFFFVLSGFLNHLKVAQNLASGETDFDPRGFLWSRARRLYPALVFSLLFTYAIDTIGGNIAPEYYFPPAASPYRYNLLTLIGNLLFLQQIIVQPFGTNRALWALAYLGWFSAVYASFYRPVRHWLGPNRAFGVVLILSAIAAVAFTFHSRLIGPIAPATPAWLLHVVAYIGMWFLGAWLADRVAMGFRLHRPTLWLIGTLLGIMGLMIAHEPRVNPLRDWLWAGICCGVILIAISSHETPATREFKRGLALFAPLASSSYTQYVLQVPPLVLVRILLVQQVGHVPSQPWLALGMVLGIILLARALAPLIEAPFTSRVKPVQITE
jgi:peptidoglycan/LPS O-acetylase OafA/YrhL